VSYARERLVNDLCSVERCFLHLLKPEIFESSVICCAYIRPDHKEHTIRGAGPFVNLLLLGLIVGGGVTTAANGYSRPS
jgi:hypothetical protein